MLSLIKFLFGDSRTAASLQEVLARGAVLIDVRTPLEFAGEHAPESVNIPLDQLPHRIEAIRAYKKPIVVCCASGMRSARAKSLLLKNGIPEVHDAGSWRTLSH